MDDSSCDSKCIEAQTPHSVQIRYELSMCCWDPDHDWQLSQLFNLVYNLGYGNVCYL